MKETGLILNAPMVLADLAGRKTQSRRPIKSRSTTSKTYSANRWFLCKHPGGGYFAVDNPDGREWKCMLREDRPGFNCPWGGPGDRIYIRETWRTVVDEALLDCIEYRADGQRVKPSIPDENTGAWFSEQCDTYNKWRPSIFQFKWAARTWRTLTDVRVERIRDISFEDIKAEVWDAFSDGRWLREEGGLSAGDCARDWMRQTWESCYPGSWDRNDWVWVLDWRKR